jgi:hypothetical protein
MLLGGNGNGNGNGVVPAHRNPSPTMFMTTGIITIDI